MLASNVRPGHGSGPTGEEVAMYRQVSRAALQDEDGA
jgi:hypothetical protein